MNWDGKRVTLYTAHDVGGERFLVAPNKRHPTFTLHSTGAPSVNPPRYILSFDDGYMQPCWRTCSALVEMGTQPPPYISGLIPIVEGDDDVQNVYAQQLALLFNQLQTPSTDLQRLEGLMQVPSDTGTRLDRVRIVYLTGVVPVDGAPNDDLVVVVLSFADSGGLHENGGGSGPPH